jgi:hypothetical protein
MKIAVGRVHKQRVALKIIAADDVAHLIIRIAEVEIVVGGHLAPCLKFADSNGMLGDDIVAQGDALDRMDIYYSDSGCSHQVGAGHGIVNNTSAAVWCLRPVIRDIDTRRHSWFTGAVVKPEIIDQLTEITGNV